MTTGYAFVLRELLAKNGIAESDVTFERAGGALSRFQELIKGSHAGTILVTPFDLLAIEKGMRSSRALPTSSAPTRAWWPRRALLGAPE